MNLNLGFLNEFLNFGTDVELMDCSYLMVNELNHQLKHHNERGSNVKKPTLRNQKSTISTLFGAGQDADDEDEELLESARDYESEVPISQVTPLCPSRGKSGGMNHTMDVLDEFLVKNIDELGYSCGTLLFSVFDCRHMGQQGFWDAVVPHFFKYKATENIFEDELVINHKNSFDRAGELPAHLRLGLRDGWLLFKILNPPSGY